MELTPLERLVLLNIIPKEGNYTTLKLVHELRQNLSFNELENKRLSFVQNGEQITWNTDAGVNQPRDIEIGEKMTDLIVECLKELDKNEKLLEDHFTLYEKFVVNE